jgi:hypothetical protein
MNPKIIKTNVKSFKPLCTDKLPFGRKIDLFRELKAWRQDPQTKSTWLSQKRKSFATALKEAKDLYGVREYFAEFGKNDDSFQIFYRT